MSETRIIKKYPNRRLYDTAISSYITLEDVKRLVLDNVSIQVIEARGKTDITHSTLLQIIVEQEEKGPPIFTTDILQQMIRFYGSSMQGVLSRTLEESAKFYSDQQHALSQGMTDAMQEIVSKNPLSLISDSAQQDSQSWQKLQDQWVKAFEEPKPESGEDNQDIARDNYFSS